MGFSPELFPLIALSTAMAACGPATSDPVTPVPVTPAPVTPTPVPSGPATTDSVLESCGGSDFSGPSIYTGTVSTSVFRCIVDGLRDHEGVQDIYGKLLVNAIWSTNLEAVQLLMGTDMDVDTADLFGTPFLDHAVGNILMIQFDLDQGLETDARKYEDAVAIARLLVARGARVTDEHADYVVLWFASVGRSMEAVRIMVDAGMDVDTRRPLDDTWSPVTALVGVVKGACWSDDEETRAAATEMLEALVEAGADVNTMTFGQILEEGSGGGYAVVGIFEDDSVLDLARNSDCSEVVAILKEAGACENLEGRRFEWGRVSGWAAILRFLQEASRLYEPREVDCTAG